jgi:hypothetical protein
VAVETLALPEYADASGSLESSMESVADKYDKEAVMKDRLHAV